MPKRLTTAVDNTVEKIDERLEALEVEKTQLLAAKEALSYFKG